MTDIRALDRAQRIWAGASRRVHDAERALEDGYPAAYTTIAAALKKSERTPERYEDDLLQIDNSVYSRGERLTAWTMSGIGGAIIYAVLGTWVLGGWDANVFLWFVMIGCGVITGMLLVRPFAMQMSTYEEHIYKAYEAAQRILST